MEIDYEATVIGRAEPLPVEPTDEIIYLRPSRYVQSDIMQPFARETFPGLDGAALVRAVGAWVHDRLTYVPEASTPTGGAVETLEAGAGVCRDYAHLTAALLRALDIPARLVSVYAPQLQPPDFHAVVEAVVDGRWVVVDSTRLAPRRGMVRMATGRDAADTAFLTNTMADILFRTLEVERDGRRRARRRPGRAGRAGLSARLGAERGEHRLDDLGRVARLEEGRRLGDDPVRALEHLGDADAGRRR